MSRQPAAPVVRPLVRLSSIDEVANFIDNYPASGDGSKLIVGSWEFRTGLATPVIFYWYNGGLSVYSLACDNNNFVSSSGFSYEISVASLPCFNEEYVISFQQLGEEVADRGGWVFEEYVIEERASYGDDIIQFYLSF